MESQLLDGVEQYWDPSAGGPAWKPIGLLLGCTVDSAKNHWHAQKSTGVLTPKAKATAEAAGKAAAKQRVVERHELIVRERSAGATWDEAALEAPKLNGDTGRGTGDALRNYWANSPLVTGEVKAAAVAARAVLMKKNALAKQAAEKEKKAEKKAEENEQRTLRNLCAQALAKFGPYLNTLAPSGADRRLLVVAHDAEGWRELKAFGDRCYEGSALYVEVCKAYDAATELEKKNKPTKKRKKRQKQKQGEPDPMPVDDTPIDDSDMRVKPVAPPVELEVDENLEAVRMFVMQYERYVAQADLAEEQSADRCNAIGAAKHQLGHAVDFLERAADSELKAASVAKLDGLLREADITAVEASLIAKREYTEHEFEWVRDFEVERICRFGKCVLDGELTRNQP